MNILMNKTWLIIIFLASTCLPVYSQVKATPQTTKTEDIKWTRALIDKSIQAMSSLIINGYTNVAEKSGADNAKVLSSLQLKQFEDQYKIFYSLPEIEKISGYSREWYGKLLKTVQELNKCSSEINLAIVRLQPEKLESLKKKYDDIRKVYKETSKDPEKAKPTK